MFKKQNNPRKGRSSEVRTRNVTSSAQPLIPAEPVPLLPVHCDASLVEAEERTAKVSLDLKLPGFGRLLVDVARVFRRRHLR